MTRVAPAAIAAGAVLTVVARADAWFTEAPGFSSPAGGMGTLLLVAPALAFIASVAALARPQSATAQRLSAILGLVLCGSIVALLVALGSGLDHPDAGGWLAAIAAAATGGGAGWLLGLDARTRVALVVVAVAAAGAAVLLPPEWDHREAQIIR